MRNAGRNIKRLPGAIKFSLARDSQFHSALERDLPLSFVGMFCCLYIALRSQENNLMIGGLDNPASSVGGRKVRREVYFRKLLNKLWKPHDNLLFYHPFRFPLSAVLPFTFSYFDEVVKSQKNSLSLDGRGQG
jgi:hypothetical protein